MLAPAAKFGGGQFSELRPLYQGCCALTFALLSKVAEMWNVVSQTIKEARGKASNLQP